MSNKWPQAGFCASDGVSEERRAEEIRKSVSRTSDVYMVGNIPKRFDNPHWFNGYGCQTNVQHPMYRTTSNEYGWYCPGVHNVPLVYYPMPQKFTNHLAESGMYRNYSLNTGMDKM